MKTVQITHKTRVENRSYQPGDSATLSDYMAEMLIETGGAVLPNETRAAGAREGRAFGVDGLASQPPTKFPTPKQQEILARLARIA